MMVYVITDVFFCAVCVYVLPVGVIACIIMDALPYGDKDNVQGVSNMTGTNCDLFTHK
jgi:hypothetical protein